MDAQDFRSLQEAYMEVVENQQLDEAREDEGLTPLQKIRKRNKRDSEFLVSKPGGQTDERRAYHKAGRGVRKERGATSVFGTMRHVGGPYTEEEVDEEVDIYDIILSHLLDEEQSRRPRSSGSRDPGVPGPSAWPPQRGPGVPEAIVAAADWIRRGPHRHSQALAARDERRRQRRIPYAALRAEQVDIYDIILSHLLDEGYANTPEAAVAIMENMSEGWINSILG